MLVATYQLDGGNPGAAFGIASTSWQGTTRFAAVDDDLNTLTVWTLRSVKPSAGCIWTSRWGDAKSSVLKEAHRPTHTPVRTHRSQGSPLPEAPRNEGLGLLDFGGARD